MRDLAYRIEPKTPNLPFAGHGAKFWGSNCHASKHTYLLSFCNIGTPEAPQEVNIGHPWSHHVSTPQFGDKIGPNLGLYKHYLKPDDARKGYHEPTMSTKPPSKSRIMRAKAKNTPVSSKSYCNRA